MECVLQIVGNRLPECALECILSGRKYLGGLISEVGTDRTACSMKRRNLSLGGSDIGVFGAGPNGPVRLSVPMAVECGPFLSAKSCPTSLDSVSFKSFHLTYSVRKY